MRFAAPLLLVILTACAGTSRPGPPEVDVAVIEGRLDALAARGFNGQVVVAHRGRVLLDKAYGHADSAGLTPVTRETGFGVASLTKNFTAAAILKLRDEGRLRLNSTLGTLFPNVPPDKREITIEELLSHRGGLATTYASDGETDRVLAVQKILSQRLVGIPGADFKYSDDGYVLLAAIIEQASGGLYEDYLKSHLFADAKMTHTYLWGERDSTNPHQMAQMLLKLDPSLKRPQWGQRGSGGVISTAADLWRWWGALDSGRVLSNKEVQELLRPRTISASGFGVGFGWFSSPTQRKTTSYWTRGNEDFGYNAILTVYPTEEWVVAVTSNVFDGQKPWSRVVAQDVETLITNH
jgi:CubicO group peptidase (beta-lactamase class C family)